MKTRITIEIDTEFKDVKDDDGEDVTAEVEGEFHKSIYDMIEDLLQRDDFEDEWVEFLDRTQGEYEFLPQDQDVDFTRFGKISIKVIQDET